MTTKGTGISSSSPEALKMARAASANAIPTSAHTIQDGKYEPRILREGAPSQPSSKPSIGAAHHSRAAGAKRSNAPPRSAKLIAIFMTRQCHRFIHRQQPPLWGSDFGKGWESPDGDTFRTGKQPQKDFARARAERRLGHGPDYYPLINANRSALIVAASVVGIPCGKPL